VFAFISSKVFPAPERAAMKNHASAITKILVGVPKNACFTADTVRDRELVTFAKMPN